MYDKNVYKIIYIIYNKNAKFNFFEIYAKI